MATATQDPPKSGAKSAKERLAKGPEPQEPESAMGGGPPAADDPFAGMATADQPTLEFLVGGAAVTGHKLTIIGGAIETERVLEKGEVARVSFEVQCVEVAFKDQFDSKTDSVVGCTRKQKARIIGPPTFKTAA